MGFLETPKTPELVVVVVVAVHDVRVFAVGENFLMHQLKEGQQHACLQRSPYDPRSLHHLTLRISTSLRHCLVAKGSRLGLRLDPADFVHQFGRQSRGESVQLKTKRFVRLVFKHQHLHPVASVFRTHFQRSFQSPALFRTLLPIAGFALSSAGLAFSPGSGSPDLAGEGQRVGVHQTSDVRLERRERWHAIESRDGQRK